METRLIRFSSTQYLKRYADYGADTDGNIWSFKREKPVILAGGWKKKRFDYRNVILRDRQGNTKNFLTHRLIALAFLPTDDVTLKVIHKNGNTWDNRVENLEWKRPRVSENQIIDIDEAMIERIKQVHVASIRKGLKVDDTLTFTNKIIDEALNQYIIQYGLRKVMD